MMKSDEIKFGTENLREQNRKIKLKSVPLTIRIIQQETGKTDGVQQHARRPETTKTFCGVKYEERDRWFDYQEDIDTKKAAGQVSCSRCKKGIEKLLRF